MSIPRISFRSHSIRTRRLIIRPLQASDFQAWVQANNDSLPSQNEWDPGQRPCSTKTRKIFKALLASREVTWKSDRFYAQGIFSRASGSLVGVVNVIPHARTILQTAAIGYVIYNNHWRKGYATEAVRAVTVFAFKQLKFHRLTAEVDVRNRHSIGLSKKLGYRREARAKKLIYEAGRWNDCYIFATTAEDWGIKSFKPVHRLTIAEF